MGALTETSKARLSPSRLAGVTYLLGKLISGNVIIGIGDTLVELAENVGKDSTEISFSFLYQGLGTLLAVLYIPALYRTFNGDLITFVGLVLIALQWLWGARITTEGNLYAWFFTTGLTAATVDTGTQILMRREFGADAGPWLTSLAFSFKAAGLYAPLLSYVSSGLTEQYAFYAIIAAATAVVALVNVVDRRRRAWVVAAATAATAAGTNGGYTSWPRNGATVSSGDVTRLVPAATASASGKMVTPDRNGGDGGGLHLSGFTTLESSPPSTGSASPFVGGGGRRIGNSRGRGSVLDDGSFKDLSRKLLEIPYVIRAGSKNGAACSSGGDSPKGGIGSPDRDGGGGGGDGSGGRGGGCSGGAGSSGCRQPRVRAESSSSGSSSENFTSSGEEEAQERAQGKGRGGAKLVPAADADGSDVSAAAAPRRSSFVADFFRGVYKVDSLLALMVFSGIGAQCQCSSYIETFVYDTGAAAANQASLLLSMFWTAMLLSNVLALFRQLRTTTRALFLEMYLFAIGGAAIALPLAWGGLVGNYQTWQVWLSVLGWGIFFGPTSGYLFDLHNRICDNQEEGPAMLMFGLNLGSSFMPVIVMRIWNAGVGPLVLPLALVVGMVVVAILNCGLPIISPKLREALLEPATEAADGSNRGDRAGEPVVVPC